MLAGPDLPEVSQRRDQADRPVTAHAEKPDVIKENHACGARRVLGGNQHGTHNHIRTAWFIYYRRPERIMLFAEVLHFFGGSSARQFGTTANNNARWLAAGVGIDDRNSSHEKSQLARGGDIRALGSRAPAQLSIDW